MSFIHNSAKNHNSNYFSFVLLLFLALTLSVIAIPVSIKWIWPNWLLLLIIYKVTTAPARYGVIFGFVTGLVGDLLMGNSLGVHALSFTVISYCIQKTHSRFFLARLVQQGMLVFGFVLLDLAAKAAFTNVIIDWVYIGHGLLSAVSTSIAWMVIFNLVGSKVKMSRM